MTITTTNISDIYIANGTQTAFDFTMTTYDENYIVAFVNEVQVTAFDAVLNSDQSVSPGGTLTFQEPPENGASVVISRILPYIQEQVLNPYSPFPAKVVEFGLDEITMQIQQLAAESEEPTAPVNTLGSVVNIISDTPSTVPINALLEYTQGFIGPLWLNRVRSDDAGQFASYAVSLERPGFNPRSLSFSETIDGRAQVFLSSDCGQPTISETNALATVQFVLDNAGGGGGDPTFNSTGWVHQTSQPNFGEIIASYDTEVLDTVPVEILGFDSTNNTNNGLVGYRFNTSDADAPTGPALPVYIVDGQVVGTVQGAGGKAPGPDTLVSRKWVEENGGGSGDFLADGSVPMTGQFKAINGSVVSPGISFANSTGTGLSYNITELVVSLNGTSVGSFNSFGLALTGGINALGGSFNNQKLTAVANPTDPQDVVTKAYGDANYGGGGGGGDFLADGSVPMTGQFNSINGTIAAPGMRFAANSGTGFSADSDDIKVSLNGTLVGTYSAFGLTLPGGIDVLGGSFNGQRLQNVGNASANGDAVSRSYGDGRYARLTAANSWSNNNTFNQQIYITSVGSGDGLRVGNTLTQPGGGNDAVFANSIALESPVVSAGANLVLAFGAVTQDTSDERLKHDIKPLTAEAANKIVMGLEPIEFVWNEGHGFGHDIGFSAQKTNPILPEAMPYNEEKDEYYYRQGPVVSALLRHVQELTEEVRDLRKLVSQNGTQ